MCFKTNLFIVLLKQFVPMKLRSLWSWNVTVFAAFFYHTLVIYLSLLTLLFIKRNWGLKQVNEVI